jgi:putative membrane-bound dehydrogenase-like protein
MRTQTTVLAAAGLFAFCMLHVALSIEATPPANARGSGIAGGSPDGRGSLDAPATPKPPLSPAEAIKHFRLHPGLKIELVAAEPAVQSPVAMVFDEQGRLFVVEMPDYPNGPKPGQKPEGRIKQLFDRDRDGVYESASVFADGLLFANGLLPWKGGFIVTCAPHILYLKDTDGDGKADVRDVWFEGFATENPQLRVSHPILGLDGYVYVVNGLRGGKVVRAGKANTKPVDLSGMDFRFDPNNLDRYEAVSGLGQFGNTFDDLGNRFVCDNRHHLRHIVIENRYLKRNPHLAARAVVHDISELEDGEAGSGGKIYPLSQNWTTSNLHAGRFTAACGVFIYREGKLGREHQGAAFTCDPTGNLVHEEVMTPTGATFHSKPLRKGVEFLASPDDWFRPVFLGSGPDGALHVVDMYRAVIEHPQFMPDELKERPDLLLGKDRGRIWRITLSPSPRWGERSGVRGLEFTTDNCIAYLEHPQAWYRTNAHRLLLERKPTDRGTLDRLKDHVNDRKTVLGNIHAAYVLNSLGALDEPTLGKLLQDHRPEVIRHAIRLAEPHYAATGRYRPAIFKHAKSSDPTVRFQAALTLGERLDDDAAVTLGELAARGVDDPWLRLAILSSLTDRIPLFLTTYRDPKLGAFSPKKDPAAAHLTFIRELYALVGARNDLAEVRSALTVLSPETAADAGRLHRMALLGLAEGVARRGGRLETLLAKIPDHDRDRLLRYVPHVLDTAAEDALSDSKPQVDRLDAIQLLGHAAWEKARPPLAKLLGDDRAAAELRLAAVRALSAQPHADVPAILLKGWKRHTPAVRREVAEAMTRTIDRTRLLLKEIEAGEIAAGEVDPLRARQLLNHRDAGIKALAQKLFRDSIPADRKKALAAYQPAIEKDGNAMRGLEVFKKHCATCHRIGDVGVNVAPDISDTRTKTKAQLLLDIINPNAAIDNNYVNYVVFTKQGRQYSGVLGSETASSITLRRAENQSDVVLRGDIAEMQSTGLSLMPEGLEKDITLDEMADLMTYLKNWRYKQ